MEIDWSSAITWLGSLLAA
ncbi:UNVERIFIED_CONTAM: hypothetical protein GTU68_007924 [Idotea baltica]|nr:hypothetical protein [Idotea baltica]